MFKLYLKPPEIRAAIEQSLPDDERLDILIEDARFESHHVAVGATSKHLVIFRKGMFNRKYYFHTWNKFGNIILEEGLMHASLLFEQVAGAKLRIDRLAVEDARKLNGHARKYITRAEAKTIAIGKPCPYCSEMVKITAKKCPHCQSDLTGASQNPPNQPRNT
jgi:hypothetical protein